MIVAAMHTTDLPPMPAEDVIAILQARNDALLNLVADRDRTIAIQADLIASSQKAIKIEPGDIERLSDLAMLLRSDTRPFFGAYIDSLERVLAGVREA